MSVDKRLFFGGVILLVIQVIWLLADMNLIHIDGISKSKTDLNRKPIGVVEQRNRQLKRRFVDSIIWQNTDKNDPLYYLDSVLTLDQSSAVLKLSGETQLVLSENTLVVLEPSNDEKTDQLRVRFSRGDLRSNNPDQALSVDANTWTVEVKKGSDISLRTKDHESLELEIRTGEVQLKGENQSKSFESGDVVQIKKDEVQQFKLDDDLVWSTPIKDLNLYRKYSHSFPVKINLRWRGPAQYLLWQDPKGSSHRIQLQPEQVSHELFLDKGLHHVRLLNESNSSIELPIEIWQAPEIHTYWPLPRDRLHSDQTTSFNWSHSDSVRTYVLKIISQDTPRLSREIAGENAEENFQSEGAFEWTVEGKDHQGFSIPYYYRSPIFFIRNPLAPPVLQTPEILPSTEPALRKPAKQSFHLWSLFFTVAHASEKTKHKALFRWTSVEGADLYVIEIDDEPNFKTPLIQTKAFQNQFVWENFSLGHYYWRVAAEGKNGEMGLFSPVTKVDLTNPQKFQPEVEEQKLTKVERNIKPRPTPAPSLAPPPSLSQAPPPSQEPPAKVVETPVKEVEEALSAISRPITGNFLFTPTYEFSMGRGSENFKTQFSGMYLLSLDTRIDFPVSGDHQDFTLKLAYRSSQFKPSPASDYPFQPKLSRGSLRASGYYGDRRKIRFGLRISSVQDIQRKGFEELSSEEKLTYGPAMLFPINESLELESGLLMGDKTYLFELQLRYIRQYLLSENLKLIYGPEIEGRFLKTDSYQEQGLLPKLNFGLSW